MTRVVLSPAGDGMYVVRRRAGEHFAGMSPLVLAVFDGWALSYCGDRYREWPSLAAARAWLNTAEGHDWLSSLPHLGEDGAALSVPETAGRCPDTGEPGSVARERAPGAASGSGGRT